jgi:parallel beta-helix repeat protein
MIIIVLLFLFLAPTVLEAATRYVDINSIGGSCHDTLKDGLSPGNPKCTLNAGINSMSSGDTLFLRQGSYGNLDYQNVCVPSGGSYGSATTIASYTGETATIRSMNLWPCGGNSEFKYVIFDRLLVDGETTVTDTVTIGQAAHHIRFQNGEVKNAWSLGFSLFGIGENQAVEVLNTKIHDIHQQSGSGGGFAFYIQSSDNIIDGCEMYNLDGYGVQFYNGYTFDSVDRNVVSNNKFYNTGFVRFFGGITVNHGTDNKIFNNIFYNTFGALDVVRNARNTLVANNTFYNNQGWGIRLDIGTSNGPNTTVKNNILVNSETIEVGGAPGTNCSHNYTPTAANCSNTVSGNILFTNPGGGIFTVQSGSVAINSGTPVSGVTRDYIGTTRPQGSGYDLGAYEFIEGGGPPVGGGPNYYVSLNGDDGHAGTIDQPWRTLAHAITVMVAGDTVYLRAGTYTEGLDKGTQAIPNGTSWTNAVTFAAYPGESVTLRPGSGWVAGAVLNLTAGPDCGTGEIKYLIFDHLIIDGTGLQNTVSGCGTDSHHIRIQDGEITGATGSGLLHFGHDSELIRTKVHHNGSNFLDHGAYWCSDNVLIKDNEIYNNSSFGIQLYATPGVNCGNNNVIIGNRIHNNVNAGVTLNNGTNVLFANNVIYGHTTGDGWGIQIDRGADSAKIYNNTFYNNLNGIQPWRVSNTSVINNILHQSGFIDDQATGTTWNKNLCTVANTGCTNIGNPMFTNGPGSIFSLQLGSPAINAGVTVTGVPTDAIGTSRPQGPGYDIGAYEYIEEATPGGNTIYLSAGGHSDAPTDVGNCTVPENPLTPRATWAGALVCLNSPGKILEVRGGTYPGAINTSLIVGGNDAGSPTQIRAYQDEVVIVQLPLDEYVGLFVQNSQYITISNLIVDAMARDNSNAFACMGSNNIIVQNSTFRNSFYEPGYISGCANVSFAQTIFHTSATFPVVTLDGTVSNITFDRSELHTSPLQGLNMNTGGGSNTNVVLGRTQVRNTGGVGVDVASSTGLVVVNSIIDHNDAGILVRNGSSGTKIYNNTIFANTTTGVKCDLGAGTPQPIELKNNIAFSNPTGNIVNDCSAQTATNLVTDPTFVGPPGDLHLGNGSDGINSGTTLPSVVVDFDGNPRPDTIGGQYDIGAYERGQTPAEPGLNVTVQPTDLYQLGMMF